MSSLVQRRICDSGNCFLAGLFFKFQSSCALRRAIIFMSFAMIFFVVKMTTPKQVFKRKYYPFLTELWVTAAGRWLCYFSSFWLFSPSSPNRHDSQQSVNTQLIWYASLQLFLFISAWNVLCYDLRKKKEEANHTQAVLSCLCTNIKNLPSVSGSSLWCSGLSHSPWYLHKSKKGSRLCRILLKCMALSSKQSNRLF